jgi:HK97 family phage major capsid protein
MKKIDELKQELNTLTEEVRSLNSGGKVEDAEAKLEEVRALKKQIAIQEEIDKEEEREIETKIETRTVIEKGDQKMEIRNVFTKAVLGKQLTEEERALVTTVDADGGFLVPKEISNDIQELKLQYKSAKELVDVVPVGTKSGSYVVEDLAGMADLINFDEATGNLAEQQPKFRNVPFDVLPYGALTPISNILLQDEKANLMGYVNRNFIKKAIRTENKKIFDALKLGKTAKLLADWKALKKSMNKDLDPMVAEVSIVVTNQDGFDYMDAALDSATGRPILQPDPTNPTKKLFMGKPVHVFSNVELPTTGTTTKKAPIFYGSLVDGVKFFDREVYEVAVSKEAGFSKNQTLVRCIERFDVKQADVDAYVYGEFDVTAG